jgi:hypothetical protein
MICEKLLSKENALNAIYLGLAKLHGQEPQTPPFKNLNSTV